MFDKEVESIEEDHKQVLTTIEWAKATGLNKVSELGASLSIYEERVAINIDPQSFGEIRQAMGKGWVRCRQHEGNNGDIFINYMSVFNPESKSLSIIIDADLISESCKRVQIGTKKIPQYKIICN